MLLICRDLQEVFKRGLSNCNLEVKVWRCWWSWWRKKGIFCMRICTFCLLNPHLVCIYTCSVCACVGHMAKERGISWIVTNEQTLCLLLPPLPSKEYYTGITRVSRTERVWEAMLLVITWKLAFVNLFLDPDHDDSCETYYVWLTGLSPNWMKLHVRFLKLILCGMYLCVSISSKLL